MKVRFSLIIAALLACLGTTTASAQSDELSLPLEYNVYAGVNLGGTAPIGLPAQIRSIDGFNPGLNLSIGADVTKMFTSKWGVSAGLRFENKGMTTEASVKDYRLTVNIKEGDEQGEKRGYYTGKVKNTTDNSYLTIPVKAIFRPSKRWDIKGGLYFAYAIETEFTGKAFDGTIRETPEHGRVAVKVADYDYSDDINRFDMGLEIGGAYRLYKGLSVKADLSWGLLSTLDGDTKKVDMTTYNIYLNIGLGYKF